MKREERHAPGFPARFVHRLCEAYERPVLAWFIRAPLCVWRKDQTRTRRLQNAGCTYETASKVAAVELRKRIVGDGISFAVHSDAPAVAVSQQNADRHRPG